MPPAAAALGRTRSPLPQYACATRCPSTRGCRCAALHRARRPQAAHHALPRCTLAVPALQAVHRACDCGWLNLHRGTHAQRRCRPVAALLLRRIHHECECWGMSIRQHGCLVACMLHAHMHMHTCGAVHDHACMPPIARMPPDRDLQHGGLRGPHSQHPRRRAAGAHGARMAAAPHCMLAARSPRVRRVQRQPHAR